MIKHLVNLATEFDKLGKISQANTVDNLIIKVSAEGYKEKPPTINYELLGFHLDEILNVLEPKTLLENERELEQSMDTPEPHALQALEKLMEVPEPGQSYDLPEWIWRKPSEEEEEEEAERAKKIEKAKEVDIGDEIIGYLPPPD